MNLEKSHSVLLSLGTAFELNIWTEFLNVFSPINGQ